MKNDNNWDSWIKGAATSLVADILFRPISVSNSTGGKSKDEITRVPGVSSMILISVEQLNTSVLGKGKPFEVKRIPGGKERHPNRFATYQKRINPNRPIPKGSPAAALDQQQGRLFLDNGDYSFAVGHTLCLNDIVQAQAELESDPNSDTAALEKRLHEAVMSSLDRHYWLIKCRLDPMKWGDPETGPSTQQLRSLSRIVRAASIATNDRDRLSCVEKAWLENDGVPGYRGLDGFTVGVRESPWLREALKISDPSLYEENDEGSFRYNPAGSVSVSSFITEPDLGPVETERNAMVAEREIESLHSREKLSDVQREALMMFYEDDDMSVDKLKTMVIDNVDGLRDRIIADHPEFADSAPTRITKPFLESIRKAMGGLD